MRRAPLALALALLPVCAVADPIPVHVAALRGNGRPIAATNAERLAVADAVAEVLGQGAREVLSGRETRARIEGLNPSSVACDALDCITGITLPLHARALALVRLSRQRDGVARIEVRLVNLRGEVIAERAEQELAPTQPELIALARLATAPIAEALQRFDAPPPTAQPPAAVTVAPPPAASPAEAPRPVPRTTARRNLGEVIVGAAALALGAGAFTVGVVGLTGAERVTRDLGENRVEVEQPSALNWAWVGAGALGLGVGVFLVVDGMRARSAPASAALVPVQGGALAVAAGRF